MQVARGRREERVNLQLICSNVSRRSIV